MSHTLKSGAKRNEHAPGYHLIPATAIRREAQRMSQGAKDHGDFNWRKGINDPEWIKECYNHLTEHLLKWAAGDDPGDDHLAAIRCGAAFLMASEESDPEAIEIAMRPPEP